VFLINIHSLLNSSQFFTSLSTFPIHITYHIFYNYPIQYPLTLYLLLLPKITKNCKWNCREKAQTVSFKDVKDFVASDALDLSNTMIISKNETNLKRGQTLLHKLVDIFFLLEQKKGIIASRYIIKNAKKPWYKETEKSLQRQRERKITSCKEILSQLGGLFL